MIYTGIGSRETPSDILQAMSNIGFTLAKKGWTLRSGGAEGADHAFFHGARAGDGKMEIYLPWDGFNRWNTEDNSALIDVSSLPNREAAQFITSQFHPAWNRCSGAARAFHTRNVYQIAGRDLETASDLVICWTPGGQAGGGTGQAIRMAKYIHIPVFDLATCSVDDVYRFIDKLEN